VSAPERGKWSVALPIYPGPASGTTGARSHPGMHRRVSTTLFLSLFASQSAVIVMSPVLVEAARDLDVSTAAAGQLRTVTSFAAGVTALLLGRVGSRVGLGRQLFVGSALLVLGSLGSAIAPTFAVLLAAQVPVGVSVSVLLTAATLASAEWVGGDAHTRVLSRALAGQSAAWIVGMPLIGLVGGISWRLGWLLLPLAAAAAVAVLVAPRAGRQTERKAQPSFCTVLADGAVVVWLVAELSANAAWVGTLVYSGAFFAESYGITSAETGCLLAVAAGAYLAGNIASRRLVKADAFTVLASASLAVAVIDAAFGAVRAGAATSTLLLSLAAFLIGGRTLVSTAFGLSQPLELRPAVASLRAATMQLGFFAGSLLGGLALAVGGYGAVGVAMGLLFVASALLLAGARYSRFAGLQPAGTRLPA